MNRKRKLDQNDRRASGNQRGDAFRVPSLDWLPTTEGMVDDDVRFAATAWDIKRALEHATVGEQMMQVWYTSLDDEPLLYGNIDGAVLRAIRCLLDLCIVCGSDLRDIRKIVPDLGVSLTLLAGPS